MHFLRVLLQRATPVASFFLLWLGEAVADPPETLPPSPLPPKGQKIVILEGQSRVFQVDDSVLSYAVADPKFCSIAGLFNGDGKTFKNFALQGLRRGVSQVTIAINPTIQTGPGGTPVKPPGPVVLTYPVVVIPDPDARKDELDQLAAFVRAEFPQAVDLQIVGVPGSPKVVVSGLVPDEWTAAKVFETIISDRICPEYIVNKLFVACPPPPPPPPVPVPCCHIPGHRHSR